MRESGDMDSTLQILHRLNKSGVDDVVIGGMAAVLHGSAIATNDVDICISAEDESFRKIGAASADVPTLASWVFWVKCLASEILMSSGTGRLNSILER
jgi:hypothetical protein